MKSNMKQQEETESLHQKQETQNSFFFTKSDKIEPPSYEVMNANRLRHVYLEEQNTYGRFVPYLLLKDQLTSEIDGSGNTALHHMCSHNSPYLPLYLSTVPHGAPILNRKSKLGHTPLDVAGLYCPKEIINMLKEKGAVDNGNVDHWAIQGANLANWSGKVDLNKLFLIHWAAYNDLPEVLVEYHREGADLSAPDPNGYSAMDLAVLNKSYKSIQVLGELGYRPKPQILRNCDSKSIKTTFKYLDESPKSQQRRKIIKLSTLPFLLLLAMLITSSYVTLALIFLSFVIWVILTSSKVEKEPYMNDNRKTAFISELLGGVEINRFNYGKYLFLHLLTILSFLFSCFTSDLRIQFWNFVKIVIIMAAIAFTSHFCVLVYGICRNLTYSEMFYSHEWPHLWRKIRYIEERKMVTREYYNPYDKGVWQNIVEFFGK